MTKFEAATERSVPAQAANEDAGVLPLDDRYFDRKAAVVDAEQRALRLLAFDCEIRGGQTKTSRRLQDASEPPCC